MLKLMYPNNYQQPIPQPISSNTNNKSRFLIVILAVVAAIGLIISVVLLLDLGNKSAEIKRLKGLVSNDGSNVVSPDEQKSYTNPVYAALDPEQYSIIFTSSDYKKTDNLGYALSINIRNGDVFSCNVKNVYYNLSTGLAEGKPFFGDIYNNCEITGVTGKVSKVFEIKNAKDNTNNVLAFLLEDGTIDYLPLRSSLESMSFAIKGKVKVDGFVIDAANIWFFDDREIEGYETTLFTLSDGSYVRFRKSMLR